VTTTTTGASSLTTLAGVALALTLLTSAQATAAPAPHLDWKTIKTPCCDVHFPAAQTDVGIRVAGMVDECVENAIQLLQGSLSERLQLVINDVTDSPNGFANVVPYDRVELRAITPEDDSELAKTDDWLRLLVQHEVLHIVHLDIIHGVPAAVNMVLGKVWPPNAVQPRMFVEGIAVFAETRFTHGGRLRSSLFAAPLRVAALKGDRWSLDDVANASRRPPGGSGAYVYGSFFVGWLAEKYGTQLFAAYAHDYGDDVIPYAVQRSIESITGRDLLLDWNDFLDDLLNDAKAFAARSDARGGPTPHRRLTRIGGSLRRPAFLPDGSMIFGSKPPNGPAGIMRIRPTNGTAPVVEAVVRTSDVADVAVVGDDIVFSQTETHDRWFSYRDLFVREKSGVVRQVTFGARLKNPSVWPSADGRRHVIAEQRTGSRSAIVDVDIDSGAVDDVVVADDGVVLYSPQSSPNGERIIVSRLGPDGRRRLALYTPALERWDVVVHDDDAADDDVGVGDSFDPVWIDDDNIVYTDDADGTFNVFSLDLRTGTRRRVVDTLGSAAQVQITPDRSAVVYSDVHLDGADLMAASLFGSDDGGDGGAPLPASRLMPLEDLDETVRTHDNSAVFAGYGAPRAVGDVEPYAPWDTLLPRRWSPEFAGDLQTGAAFGLSVDGSDAANLVSWSLRGAIDTLYAHPALAGTVRFTNTTLPLNLQAELRPIISSRSRSNDGLPELHIENQLRGGVSVTLPLRRRRFTHNVSLGTQRVVSLNETPVTSSPDAITPTYPASVIRPVTQVFTLDWFYSSTEQYRDSVSTERGISTSVRLRFADRYAFSDLDVREVFFDFRAFQPVPGLSNHTIAAYVTGGSKFDDRPGNLFFLGGFVNRSVLQDLFDGNRSGPGVLRGFPIGHVIGDALAAGTLEYRFPLIEIERGIETLPLFVDRIHGAVYVDTASAFTDRPSALSFASSAGAELRLQVVLGYYGAFLVRVGYARGLTAGGLDQPYTVMGFNY